MVAIRSPGQLLRPEFCAGVWRRSLRPVLPTSGLRRSRCKASHAREQVHLLRSWRHCCFPMLIAVAMPSYRDIPIILFRPSPDTYSIVRTQVLPWPVVCEQ